MDTDIIYANNVSRYPQCISRTKLGNCDPVGGFCTSVPKKICDLQKHESREEQLMDDFISRKAAVDAVETIGFDFSDSDLSAVELEEVCEAIGEVRQEWLQRIKRLPSAQPEIIHCKECADYTEIRHVEGGTIGVCESLGLHTCDRWFCGNAERRK